MFAEDRIFGEAQPLSKMSMMNSFPGLSFGVARVLLHASLIRNEFTKLQN
jgi:hypothetical protein